MFKERVVTNYFSPSELIGLLNQQENIELISAMLALIYDLWQHCFELRTMGLSNNDMSSLLQRFVDLKSSELSKQAKTMLSFIETDVSQHFFFKNESFFNNTIFQFFRIWLLR